MPYDPFFSNPIGNVTEVNKAALDDMLEDDTDEPAVTLFDEDTYATCIPTDGRQDDEHKKKKKKHKKPHKGQLRFKLERLKSNMHYGHVEPIYMVGQANQYVIRIGGWILLVALCHPSLMKSETCADFCSILVSAMEGVRCSMSR